MRRALLREMMTGTGTTTDLSPMPGPRSIAARERFEDFQKDLGIARNILCSRLNRLVDAGIFAAVQYQDNPPRSEYRLTPAGKDLLDVLLALWRWGDRWNAPQDAAIRELIHLDCGKPTHIVAGCAHCGGELTRANLRIEPGLDIVEQKLARAGQST